MTRLVETTRTLLAAAILVLPALAGGAGAADEKSVPLERNCFFQMLKSKGETIDCDHLTWLTPEERDDLKRVSRNYLEDATCKVAVRLPRRMVEEALSASDHVFQSPPQPVTCDLKTSNGPIAITATFAPRVVFKNGTAVQSTPGLADVKGVNPYLAWPVVHYVNHAQRITGTMLLMINGYKANYRELAAQP